MKLLITLFLVIGTLYGIEIPRELWFDGTRPADVSERRTVHEKLPGNVFDSKFHISFTQLPRQIQLVIELTAGGMYRDHIFNRFTILIIDPGAPNESVMCHIYTPSFFDEDGGETAALDSWRFLWQDGVPKLYSLSLREDHWEKTYENLSFSDL